MTFTSSMLEHYDPGGGFMLEGKIKKHKMVVLKGPIPAEMWRTISRCIYEIELICKKAEENLHVKNDGVYLDINLYDEIVSWRAPY